MKSKRGARKRPTADRKRSTQRLKNPDPIEQVRARFLAFLQFDRADFAREFMTAYRQWAASRALGHDSFAAFVRDVDQTVPTDSNGYKRNRAYMQADYLRKLATRPMKA